MMNKPIFEFRTVLSLATLSACMLSITPAAHAGLLGGATGGLGGTLSPRQLDLNGQGRANVARDGHAQLPRGEKLRDAASGAAGEAKGTLGAARDAAADKARQAPGMVNGMASGSATTGGAIATEKADAAKGSAADTTAAGSAGKAAGTASASGDAGAKRDGRSVNVSASGQAGVSR